MNCDVITAQQIPTRERLSDTEVVYHHLPARISSMEKSDVPIPRGLRRYLVALPILILFFLVLVGVDSLSGAILWIAAGNMSYLEENVVGFVFQDTVFDLAVLAVVRGFLLAASLIFLEQWVLRKLPSLMTSGSSRPKLVTVSLAVVIIVAIVSFGYGIAKGAFVIKFWPETSRDMHIAYKVLCIVSVVLPLVEVVLCGVCWWLLRRIERVLHLQALIINDDATPAEQQTEMKRRFGRAELRRLLGMAQPVSVCLSVREYVCVYIKSLGVQAPGCSSPIPPPLLSPSPLPLPPLRSMVLWLWAFFV